MQTLFCSSNSFSSLQSMSNDVVQLLLWLTLNHISTVYDELVEGNNRNDVLLFFLANKCSWGNSCHMAEKRNKPQHPSNLLIELGQLGKWVTRRENVVCKLCPPDDHHGYFGNCGKQQWEKEKSQLFSGRWIMTKAQLSPHLSRPCQPQQQSKKRDTVRTEKMKCGREQGF